jgi:hypothetical protein
MKHKNIIHYIKTIGNYQAMLDVEIFSREALRELIQEIHQNFSDLVVRVEINEVYKIDKFSQMASEYPELEEHIPKYSWEIVGVDEK